MTKPAYEIKPPPGGKVALMFDSGVFSAWNRGGTIDLDEYITYLKRNEKLFYSYVVCDSIPGTFGSARTERQVEESARLSYRNLQRMKDAGLDPIPVFHQGEDFKWLFKMIEDGDEYIGISTAKDLTTGMQRKWLDYLFTMLTDRDGRPKIRVHGFGITNPQFLLRYPWFTCDSTTWALHAGMGHILIPQYEGIQKVNGTLTGGAPNWQKRPLSIVTSGISQESKTGRDRQFEKFVYEGRELTEYAINRFITDYIGVTMYQARNSAHGRRRSILGYYLNLMKNLKPVRFNHRSSSILKVANGASIKGLPKKGADHQLALFFATIVHGGRADVQMNAVGALNRLLSYHQLRTMSEDILERYVMTGTGAKNYREPKPPQNWESETYRSFRAVKLEQRLARPLYEEN